MAVNRGSEWKKWDLHIHTPDTHLASNYGGKWTEYLEALAASDIDVFGITNYFCFKQGELQRVKDYLEQKGKVILPNLEFRIHQPNKDDEYINIHVLFSDNKNVTPDRIQKCLNKLELFNTDTKGRKLFCEYETLLEVGFGKATVDIKKLTTALENDFQREKDYIIIGCSTGYGSFRPSPGDGRSASIAIEIDKVCHAFFGTENNVKFFLDSKRYSGAKSKPVITGSDAHAIDSINNKYCWIKGDCTYNGFRQILFEPKHRVKIQKDSPSKKDDFQLIDKVKFITNDQSTFSNEYINLNPDLNTIIGGKSSGKSMLLYYIAKTIDKYQVDTKAKEVKQTPYTFENTPGFNFEVIWKDGCSYKFKDTENKDRLITYIPQLYINHIAEASGENALNELILNFLEQKESFAKFHDETQNEILSIKRKIKDYINELFQILERHQNKKNDLKLKGDKTAILTSKGKINDEIEQSKKNSNFTDAEQKEYAQLLLRHKIHYERSNSVTLLLNALQDYHKTINDLKLYADIGYAQAKKDFAKIEKKYDYGFSKIIDRQKEEIQKIQSDNLGTTEKYILKIEGLSLANAILLSNIEALLLPYQNRIGDGQRISEYQSKINEYNNTLQSISELEVELKQLADDSKEVFENLKASYRDLHQKYISIKNELNGKHTVVSEERGIQLRAILSFDNEKFNDNFSTQITKNTYLKVIFGNYFDDENYYKYSELTHLENIFDIFKKVAAPETNNIRFNKSWSKETAINTLLEDYFKVEYKLFQKGEEIIKMSPGKRGLILLILLIHLNNSKYPILIDQPEDNLDNRTIYQELKEYIKEKKNERQIIIVTHNSNLVVTTDAENVIVANRQGEEKNKENVKSAFEYINGSLENSYKRIEAVGILNKMGIKEHVCEILEGGETAFQERESKYGLDSI